MKKIAFRGDTIIEVLISITVVSVILGGAYASANRSLSATRQAQERGESLKLAEEQLERLKALSSIQPAIFTDPDRFFCIKSDLTYIKFSNVADMRDFPTYDDCEQAPQGGISYYVIVERAAETFIVHSNWYRANGQGYDRLELVYRLYPNSESPGLVPTCADPTVPGCGGGPVGPAPTDPNIELEARPGTVNRGARTNLIWTISNGTFDSCRASNSAGNDHSSWNGDLPAADVAGGGGSERSGRMNEDRSSGNSTVFIIECWKGSFKDMDSVTVRVRDPGSVGPSGPTSPGSAGSTSPGGRDAAPGTPGEGCTPRGSTNEGVQGGGSSGTSGRSGDQLPYGPNDPIRWTGEDGTSGSGESGTTGTGTDNCSGNAGRGSDGGSTAPGSDGSSSAPSAPSAPSGPASGTICSTRNGERVCTRI